MNAAARNFNTGKLTVTMPNDTDVVAVRTFDAPRDLVYEAHANADIYRKWAFGPDGWRFKVCEIDARPGGKYLWIYTNEAGEAPDFGFTGAFIEADRPSLLSHTEIFLQDPAAPVPTDPASQSVATMTLTEKDGKTTLTATMRFVSKEIRDMVAATGMTDGMEIGYARLDTLLAEQAKA